MKKLETEKLKLAKENKEKELLIAEMREELKQEKKRFRISQRSKKKVEDERDQLVKMVQQAEDKATRLEKQLVKLKSQKNNKSGFWDGMLSTIRVYLEP